MRPRHLVAFAGLAAAVVAIAAAPVGVVSAHIDPDPVSAPAGSVQSVGFTVEHGCDGSATVQLDMRVPDGITDAVPEPPPGWSGSVADGVVTFAGGPLPDDTAGTFRVHMTLPTAADTTIYFPFVQRCEVGELRWIDLPGTDLEEPAPAMSVTAAAPTPAPAPAPPPTPAASTSTVPAPVATTTTDVSTTTATTADRTGTTTTGPVAPPTTASESSVPSGPFAGSDGGPGAVVFFAVVAVLVGLGALAIRQIRRAR